MHELTKLANQYLSDKGTECGSKHGFTELYGKHLDDFRYDKINVLEIGVNDGASMRMWYDYFPNAIIYGLDIEDKSQFNNDRVSCGVLDQSKKDHLDYFAKNSNLTFDLILDDGSHHISDQQLTFGYLFPLLNKSGMYVIEDLHTSLCDPNTNVYGRPMENRSDKSNTTLTYLRNKPYNSVYLSEEQNHYIQHNVKDVLIFERDNLNVPNEYKNKSITSVVFK